MCLIEDQSWIDCIDITSRWDTFVLFHLYGNKGVSLPLWPIRPRWFHTYSPCAEPLGDGHEGMWARFGSQGSIALNWHSRYSGTRYSGTWLYYLDTHRSPPVAHTDWCAERTKSAPTNAHQKRTYRCAPKSAPTGAHQKRTYRCAPKAHLQVRSRCAPTPHLHICTRTCEERTKSAPTGAHLKRTYRSAPKAHL